MTIANNIDAFQFSDPTIVNGDLASLADDAVEYGGGSGVTVTYNMRGKGAATHRYWPSVGASDPTGVSAPESCTNIKVVNVVTS